ncbi:MAG: C-GCAxxG-C-C family protein [Dehalococcoidia bacterium]|nr:C-GCAxxG-C-C family protein [Dehalococcoidia bacterium]MDD5494246.1 C-GCAxxG-C-C family protein [Dehalococcoidia bacterium]
MSKSISAGTANFAELLERKVKEELGTEARRERIGELAYNYFQTKGGCAQSILQAFTDVLELKDGVCFKAIGGLHGGGRCGYTCGALNTGFMFFNMILGRENIDLTDTPENKMLMMESCHRLAQWFKLEYRSTVCSEITGYDWFGLTDLVTSHPALSEKDRRENCARLTGGTAYKIAEILHELVERKQADISGKKD